MDVGVERKVDKLKFCSEDQLNEKLKMNGEYHSMGFPKDFMEDVSDENEAIRYLLETKFNKKAK